jgi:polyhydroxyalkanoate synthesis regulator phasin
MEEKKSFSTAEKRWLVREIEAGRITIGEAKEMVSDLTDHSAILLRRWQHKFANEISLTLPSMTEKEKIKLESAHKHIKKLEKELEHAQMKNAALETMIDLAEQLFKIPIRKKSGPKQ